MTGDAGPGARVMRPPAAAFARTLREDDAVPAPCDGTRRAGATRLDPPPASVARVAMLAAVAAVAALAIVAPGCAARRGSASAAPMKLPAPTGGVGLSVVRWFVPADPAARRAGLDALRTSGAVRPVASPLSAHGILVFRATAARLPEVAAALGAGLGARRVSLGQATNFADLLNVALAARTPVLAEGRPDASDEVLLRLELRGWCFPTVDGAAARVEIRLVEDDARVQSISMDPSRVRAPARELRRGREALELSPGEVLILVDAPVAPPEKDASDPLAALPPPTRGALLFETGPFPDRVAVLVVEPGFADMLPPGAATAGAPGLPTVEPAASPEMEKVEMEKVETERAETRDAQDGDIETGEPKTGESTPGNAEAADRPTVDPPVAGLNPSAADTAAANTPPPAPLAPNPGTLPKP